MSSPSESGIEPTRELNCTDLCCLLFVVCCLFVVVVVVVVVIVIVCSYSLEKRVRYK